MRVTREFRFKQKAIGEEFPYIAALDRVETWRVVEDVTPEPYGGGLRVYRCEEVLPKPFLREIGEGPTDDKSRSYDRSTYLRLLAVAEESGAFVDDYMTAKIDELADAIDRATEEPDATTDTD